MDAVWLGLGGNGLFALPHVCRASNPAPGLVAEIEHPMNQVISYEDVETSGVGERCDYPFCLQVVIGR